MLPLNVILAKLPGINPDAFRLTLLLQNIANGLSNGALYAAMALTVVIIYRTTGHLNFAQGEMAMFSTFLVFVLSAEHGVPIWIALLVAVVLSMLGGAAIERVMIRPVESRPLTVVIVTLALFLIFNAGAAAIWGTQGRNPVPQPFPGRLADKFNLIHGRPNFFITYTAIGIWITLALLVLALLALLHRTKLGLAYRTVASNRESAQLVGVPVGRMLMLGWALAAGMGAIVGTMGAEFLGRLDFNFMAALLIYGFAAACLGGFDSITGAVVGGAVVGVAEALLPSVFSFIGTETSLVVALIMIVVVLSIKPEGLFGSRRIERV